MPLECSTANFNKPEIIDLRANEANKGNCRNVLGREIIQGLTKHELVVPGSLPEDRFFAYRKTIPTIVLYDEYGLELYDKLTTVPDYYPFEVELAIIKRYGHEIASRLSGFDTDTSTELSAKGVTGQRVQSSVPPVSTDAVTASNRVSMSIIELGAGSLKKTSHLLRNVTGLLEGRALRDVGHRLSKAEYYALDLEYAQLVSTLTAIQLEPETGVGPKVGAEVQAKGICGTYTQGLQWISRSLASSIDRDRTDICRKAILWLGSSIGNFSPLEAVEFLKDQLCPVLDAETRVLIGIDNCRIPEKVQRAYDDSEGVTRQFILNGITAVARQLGLIDGSLNPEQFEYVSRYNIGKGRNEAYLRARKDISITVPALQGLGPEPSSPTVITFEAGELILIEKSYKLSTDEVYRMFDQAGLRVIQSWSDVPDISAGLQATSWIPTHTLYLVEQPPFKFVHTTSYSLEQSFLQSRMRDLQAVDGPRTPKWDFLVRAWDTMNMQLIPTGLFGENKALLTGLNSPTELSFKTPMVDLSVSDETALKRSSGNVPKLEEWVNLWKAWDTVTLGMIPRNMLHSKPIDLRHIFLFYLGHIPVFADIHISQHFGEPMSEPARFAKIFERGIDPNMKNPDQCHDHSQVPENEAEWPGLEEVLQLRDTVRKRLRRVYDELEGAGIGSSQCSRSLARMLCMIYEHEAMHLETLLYMVVQSSVTNPPPGFTVPDWSSLSRAWDMNALLQAAPSELIEYPAPQTIFVGHDDLEEQDSSQAFSWDHDFGWDNESPSRKAVVGPFKLECMPITNKDYLKFLLANHQPQQPISAQDIPASWLYRYSPASKAVGGHELHIKTVYGPVNFYVAQHWPLQASGTQLGRYAKAKGGRLPTANELRVFRMDNPSPGAGQSHIGFQQWHPVPATRPTKGQDGIWRGGSNGGVWEWSSTAFEAHPGFKPSTAYPGYSQDFFDGEHFVILGGSWATIPRIAHRQSFVNWYQFEYPYVFAGGRVAYDY